MNLQSRPTWLASLSILVFVLIGCAAFRPRATVGTGTAAGGFVITVLATDVTLKTAPDDRSSSVSATFTINGNTVNTMVYVSGELPVLQTNVIGANGVRWTRVHYRGHIGPQDTGVDMDVAGYVRNDLVSAPHAPGAPAIRNPITVP